MILPHTTSPSGEGGHEPVPFFEQGVLHVLTTRHPGDHRAGRGLRRVGTGQEKLAFLIPTLFGPEGLIVDSEARAADGGNPFRPTSTVPSRRTSRPSTRPWRSGLASVPLPAPASGFTYTFDPAPGRVQPLDPELRPHRRRPRRDHRQEPRLDRDRLPAFQLRQPGRPRAGQHPDRLHPRQPGRGHRARRRDHRAERDCRRDLPVHHLREPTASPIGSTCPSRCPWSASIWPCRRVATMQRIGTRESRHPLLLQARQETPSATRRRSRNRVTPTGIGDVAVRLKASVVQRSDLRHGGRRRRPPPHRRRGEPARHRRPHLKPFLVMSSPHGAFSPHLNAAYQWNGKSLLGGNVLTGEKAGPAGRGRARAGRRHRRQQEADASPSTWSAAA